MKKTVPDQSKLTPEQLQEKAEVQRVEKKGNYCRRKRKEQWKESEGGSLNCN